VFHRKHCSLIGTDYHGREQWIQRTTTLRLGILAFFARLKGETSNEERKMELRATYNRSKASLRPLLFLLLAFLAGCLAAGLFFNRQC